MSQQTQRTRVKIPPTLKEHQLSAFEAKVREKIGKEFRLESIDKESGTASFVRTVDVATVSTDGKYLQATLPDSFATPSAGDRAAASFSDQYPGYEMIRFEPHLKRAILAKMTPDCVVARAAVAEALGVKPWDVEVAPREQGGYLLTRLPTRYTPSKHDEKLAEVAVTKVPGGQPGWFTRIDGQKLTGEIIPAELPTFPAAIPTDMSRVGADRDKTTFGMKLPAPGQTEGDPAYIDWTASNALLLGGTPGSGKRQTLSTRLPVPVSAAHPSGWLTMREVRAGDRVYGANGVEVEVSWVSPVVRRPTYRIGLADGQTVEADVDHVWRARLVGPDKRHPAMRARALAIADAKRAGHLPLENLALVTGRPVDLLAEILLDADVLTDPRNVDVSAALDVLEPADGWHLVTTEELMTGVWELPIASPVLGRGRIGDPGAVADAWRAGVRIEPAYLRAELSDRAELLDRIGVGRIDVSGLPFGCVADLLELARSLGYAAKKVGPSVLITEASANPVVSVTPIGEVAGCCIRVGAPDHLYLTEGFVPTHNTVTLNRMLADQIAAGSECVVVDDPAKSVDFLWAKPFLREGGWGCDSDRAAVTALALAYEEGQKRAKVLAEAGVVNWLELPPGEQFTPIFIIVDELSALTVTEKEPTALPKDHPMRMEVAEANLQRVAIMRYISKIIAEERFVGVRIVLSTQVTNAATGVPPALKSKIGHKMLQGSNPSKSARMQAFSDETAVPPVPENVRAAGRVAKGTGGGELEGQAPFVYKSSYAAAADYARELERRGVRRASSPEPSMADIARLAPTLNEDADFDEPAPSRFDEGGFGDPGGHVPELKGAAKANHDRAVEMAQARVKGLDREKFAAQQEAKAQGAHDRPLRTPEEAAAALLG